MSPDGLFLSNGPGNPEDVQTVINVVRELRGKLPIFGICLGNQMISLALGAKTFKMKFSTEVVTTLLKILKQASLKLLLKPFIRR